MSSMKPGTLDDNLVVARKLAESAKQARASLRPTRTQTNQTTDKVNAFDSDISAAQKTAEAAQTIAQSASTTATEAKTQATATQTALENLTSRVASIEMSSDLPVGCVLLTTSSQAPETKGTWRLLTGVKLPMTGLTQTIYAWERTA